MTALNLTPIIGTAPTAEADRTTGPSSAAEEWVIDIQATNKHTAPVDLTVNISDGTTTKALCDTYTLPEKGTGENSLVVATGLPLPFGWKIRDRASQAGVVDIVITGMKRAT